VGIRIANYFQIIYCKYWF